MHSRTQNTHQDGADQLQLVGLILAGKDSPSREQLNQNAADGPNIDSGAILSGSQQQLWRAIPGHTTRNKLSTAGAHPLKITVPQGNDTIRHLGRLLAILWFTKRAREAKVCKLQFSMVVGEHVGPCTANDERGPHALANAASHPAHL